MNSQNIFTTACVLMALGAVAQAAPPNARQPDSAGANSGIEAPSVSYEPDYRDDGMELQNIMQFQAALRAAKSELEKLDDAARTQRIAEIARGLEETRGLSEVDTHSSRTITARRPSAEAIAAEDSIVADGQARYLAAVEELRKSWPAQPTDADFKRLEALKEQFLPE